MSLLAVKQSYNALSLLVVQVISPYNKQDRTYSVYKYHRYDKWYNETFLLIRRCCYVKYDKLYYHNPSTLVEENRTGKKGTAPHEFSKSYGRAK